MDPERRPFTLTVALLATSTLLLLAACGGGGRGGGGGGGGGESRGAFCARVKRDQRLLENSSGGDSSPAALKRGLDEVHQLVVDAPPPVKGDMRTLAGVLDKLAKLDLKDQAAFGTAFAAMLDPKVIAASAKVKEYAKKQCGVDLKSASSAGEASGGSPPSSGSGGSDPSIKEALGGLDANTVGKYLDDHYGSAPWRGKVNGYGVTSGEVELDTELAAGSSAAIEVCKAASGLVYQESKRSDWAVTVKDAQNDTLVRRAGESGSCAAGG